jgi:hypothetical protein
VSQQLRDELASRDAEILRLRRLLREVSSSGHDYMDARVEWVDVQIDKDLWIELQEFRDGEELAEGPR